MPPALACERGRLHRISHLRTGRPDQSGLVADTSSANLIPELVDLLVDELLKVPARVWKETFAGLLANNPGRGQEELDLHRP